jgi:hypothetical protein
MGQHDHGARLGRRAFVQNCQLLDRELGVIPIETPLTLGLRRDCLT